MGGGEETMRLLCSHGGRLVPCGPGGGLRPARALAVPREVPFRELRARLAEKVKAGAGGDAVTAVRYRLADEGLDDELAHMLDDDEYDRLKATRPSASFRVFVSTAVAAAGVQQRRCPHPPVAPPMMRRARSKLELAGLATAPVVFELENRRACWEFEWWSQSTKYRLKDVRKGLNSLVTLVVWEIWKHRTDCVFNGTSPNVVTVFHGGRLVPCGPGGGLRYVGGETRALVVPRGVPFRELRARLAEKELGLAGLPPAPPPIRRVHSAQELAAGSNNLHQCFYDRRRQSCCCCCCYRRRDQRAPVRQPARLVRPLPSMSKNIHGARPAGAGQEAAKAAVVAMELDNRRACWEFE
uniref:PB1 domain-containing protein n=1 Tax=Oryza punctata TaxID=4537 RepID=A0A0E0KHN2_ORYPU